MADIRRLASASRAVFSKHTAGYTIAIWYIHAMTKHLVDIDDKTLRAAQRRLQTRTIKETVNRALRAVAGAEPSNVKRVKRALDELSRTMLEDREAAWR